MAIGFFDVLRTTLRDDSPEAQAKRRAKFEEGVTRTKMADLQSKAGGPNPAQPATAAPEANVPTFTNADIPAAQKEQSGLRAIPGRDTNPYAANFVDRLVRFRQNNPEFTPRSQRANKGVTIIDSLADVRARNARVGQGELRDALMRQPRRGGRMTSSQRQELANLQKSDQAAGVAYAKQAAELREAMSRNALTARGQDLTHAAALRGQNITAVNNAADNYTAAQRLGLEAAKYGQNKLDQDRRFKNQNAETVSKLTDDLLSREYGPDTVNGEINTARQRASQFFTLSNAKSADDLAYVDQLYKAAKPLENVSNISASFWPALARMVPIFRANNVKLESADDVINAIEKYGQGLDVSGQYNVSPEDLSLIQQQRVRTLRDQLQRR